MNALIINATAVRIPRTAEDIPIIAGIILIRFRIFARFVIIRSKEKSRANRGDLSRIEELLVRFERRFLGTSLRTRYFEHLSFLLHSSQEEIDLDPYSMHLAIAQSSPFIKSQPLQESSSLKLQVSHFFHNMTYIISPRTYNLSVNSL